MIRNKSNDIAIIGISARFPGCKNLHEFWDSILNAQVRTKSMESKSLIECGVPKKFVENPNYVPVHGYLEETDRFDNGFFKISPREAELMDPQHRLMLEMSWAALEDAGYGDPMNRPKTAVFSSVSESGYQRSLLTQISPFSPRLDEIMRGTRPEFISSLISYKLNLTGPAISLHTACSSSLVSVHLAVQSLRNKDCDQALVVSASIPFPQTGYMYMPGGIYSASGVCRPFDHKADGVVAGAGAACIVLQRLEDVYKNGPKPYGIILGTAINNDGSLKTGYFAPSIQGQSEVIQSAVKNANIDPSSLGYLETHGTGTNIGDPIEWSAATESYKSMGVRSKQIAIGALKANIGHLDATAGIASLIKALYVVREGIIPPIASFSEMNPLMNDEDSPLFIPQQACSWKTPKVRRAGVSSFGIGGTNAHVIIEHAPVDFSTDNENSDKVYLIAISALDKEALGRAKNQLVNSLKKESFPICDVSYTLVNGRKAFPERLAVCARTREEIIEYLENNIRLVRGHASLNNVPPIIFLFPGQGSQYPGMAIPFVKTIPGFLDNLNKCLNAFDSAMRNKLKEALLNKDFPETELNETNLAQPALFAFEYSIAVSLMKLGISPSALMGHSLGEITAACIAGAFDLESAINIITSRGNAMQDCIEGAMLSLNCSDKRANELIAHSKLQLYIAAINTPEFCVVAGRGTDIDEFETLLGGEIICHRLKSTRAFHSPFIGPAIQKFEEVLDNVEFHKLKLPIVLNATGEIADRGDHINANSLITQAQATVKFSRGLESLQKKYPHAVMIEVGAGRTLSSMAKSMSFRSVAMSPNKPGDSQSTILNSIGTLWSVGCPVNLSGFYERGNRTHLPSYPFFGNKFIAPEALAGLKIPENISELSQTSYNKKNSYVESSSSLMKREDPLEKIWVELFKYDDINDHSDFFELGGDSMLMIKLVHEVNSAFSIQVPPRKMLSASTLGRQKKIIEEHLEEKKIKKVSTE